MHINIKSLNPRRTFQITVQPGFTTDELKASIEAQEDVPAKSQKLVFSGKPLRDGVTLQDAGVQKDATLHLIAKLKTHVEVHVRVMSGRTFDLDCEPRASVAEVVRNISELLELDERPRVLCANQRCLNPASDLSQHGPIKDKDVLHLVLVPEPNMPSLYLHLGTQADADRARAYGLAGSLYARCGGIFGVASFVDRCMDAWMADPTLNANDAVATWHQRAQRCGFKFLVTQLMGYLCGGPQVYTGRSMAASHKHLAIREEEWASFMECLQEVCDELGLPTQEVDDVRAVIASMQADCVVADGEAVPPNPGHPAPAGDSLYARLGGAYPVALFCDRLVDALLSDRTVKIPLDAKRNEASLKYLFTELVCSIAGGMEAMTAPSLLEARLLCSSKELFQLLRCAEAASDHLRDPAARTALLQALYAARELLLDPARTESDDPHGYEAAIARIARETGVPMAYVVGGGAVFFAGRDLHFGAASPAQQKACWEELQRLGFRRQKVLKVKSADEAASALGQPTSRAAASTFVEAEKRVHGDARTLYGRGGGVFGLAKLADQLMDTWMKNATLNANAMVAPWTESGQRQGFKFLVTQVIGYLTGGPQRYTGQPMDVAHKHLNISAGEWDAFMRDAALTMEALHIDAPTQAEFGHIFAAFRSEVIVERGERVPPDPKQCRKRPDGDSTYAQAGGVYPLAAFADALVELALACEELQIAWDDVRKPGAARHPPGLKYLFTELVCSAAGGPETVTAKGFEPAKLGVLADKWGTFKGLATRAAEGQWPHQPVISQSIEALVEELRPEICVGMVQAEGDSPRKRLREQGYSHVQTTAALLECDGDAAKAAELLRSGWKLPPPDAIATGKCPFGHGAPAAPAAAGTCPFGHGAPAAAPEPALPEPLASAVRTMAGAGMTPEAIAAGLKLELAPVQQTLDAPAAPAPLSSPATAAPKRECPFGFGRGERRMAGGDRKPAGAAALALSKNPAALVEQLRARFNIRADRGEKRMAGRVLGDAQGGAQQRQLDELLLEPAELCCPITLMLLTDPVIASDGVLYERAPIREVVRQDKLSPMSLEDLEPELVPAAKQRTKVLAFMLARAAALLKFVEETQAVERAINGQAEPARLQRQALQTITNTALDRAQLYVSKLLAAAAGAVRNPMPGSPEARADADLTSLCQQFCELMKTQVPGPRGHVVEVKKPVTADILYRAQPRALMSLTIRVMTGAETTVEVSPSKSIAEVGELALSRVFATNGSKQKTDQAFRDKQRTLNHDGKQLPPASKLADHHIPEGVLLHLILVPAVATAASTEKSSSETNGSTRAYGLAGSLYARCGGIFGVASFVDRCMDAWMADPTLNANDAVATWHQRAQRCGFKFLVTQLMGYLCGGPQVYTGRSMAASHKHLAIREEEWASFMECLQEVCDELGLPTQEVDDVRAVIASMQADCVVADGEAVPPNPGHPAPAGDSLYARLGGAYPVALFCDRLVDALLSDRTVKIPLDAKRNEASLKYLFTELVCSIAGGMEAMTAPFLAETRLRLSGADMVKLLACVASAADHLEDKQHAVSLALLLHEHMELILAKPINWLHPVTPGESAAAIKDHAAMREEVGQIARDVEVPLLYVPHGKSGFLLAMDEGAAPGAKSKRVQMTAALGFDEAEGGVAMLPQSSDKDILFLIDKSGSMSGARMSGAIANARKIYDKYTTEVDQVGMIAFNNQVQTVFPLGPRSDVKRKQPGRMMSRAAYDDEPDGNSIMCYAGGGTAFFDALIKVTTEVQPKSSFSYLVALTDGADKHSRQTIAAAKEAIKGSPWKLLIIGLEVQPDVRAQCEDLANSSQGGMYIHAAGAGAALDEAFAAVAAQFVMPKVKSADAAAAGGGARGV